MKSIYSKEEVKDLIKSNKVLLLAGDEALFSGLPSGNWIGGSIPYFMGETGGVTTKGSFFVTVLPDECKVSLIKQYAASQLKDITADYPKNGISFIIIPATSDAHIKFANEASSYPNLFNSPLVGWISGLHLDDLGKVAPRIFNGETQGNSSTDAIVMHVELPDNMYPQTDILNLFTQGSGDTIEFESDGFEVTDAIINGKKMNFSDYLSDNKINLELPLVADYSGAMVNVSFQSVNKETKKVNLYAPVFKGVIYKVATPISNYEVNFKKEIEKRNVTPIFSCNCILNYLYAGLEGKKTGKIMGPMTFGEIAYMLLNQTLVYVTLVEK